MLTLASAAKPHRKDRPWLLVIMTLIWISGATFFHSPWEPYEPYVVAVVKSILNSNSWLVPYIATGSPYLDLQPFYFWLYALIIKLCSFSDIANAVRLINSAVILGVIYLLAKIGSGLAAYKNGRSVVMLLISSIGFINNAYQISPNIIILLGFALYFYALQQVELLPGISSWLLGCGLIFISLNFTGEFIVIALVLLVLLPLLDKSWRTLNYLITAMAGVGLFVLIFSSYAWQLNSVDPHFYVEWKHKYTNFIHWQPLLANLVFYAQLLLWYLIPSWILTLWTLYKRRWRIFSDKILRDNVMFALLLFAGAMVSANRDESAIFPILLPFILLASVEIDSIRISIVSLLNWFSICAFGVLGLAICLLYTALNFGHPAELLSRAQFYAPDYIFNFNFWQLALAIAISAIWVLMITRKHIRGREMLTNWASGTTFCLVIFMSLCLPWFNALLSFKDVVASSSHYLKLTANQCIATNEYNKLPTAIWYYYADVRLLPDPNFRHGHCNQALIALGQDQSIAYPEWRVIWSAKRPIDSKRYVLLERIKRE